MPKLIDTHSHLNFNSFKEDLDETTKRTLDADFWMINVGSQSSTSERAVKIAEQYKEGVYASVGLHPAHLCESHIDESEMEKIHVKTRSEEFDYNFYKNLAKSGKVVAIGECGLDYTYLPADCDREAEIKKQKDTFRAQIKLAKELEKPLIIHSRDTHEDTLAILKEEADGLKAVLHCYVGNWAQAQEYLNLGFFISFTGIITFKVKEKLAEKQKELLEVVEKAPIDRIMVETDAPYLSPDPHRGKRNEPLYVEFVARKIAEIKGLSFEEVAEQTTKNAVEFFGLPLSLS
jgi:TatD DNase family protein